MRTGIVVLLSSFVVFAASAVAQEVTVDAGVNVGESGEDTQSSTDNLPTLDLEAGMAKSQPQPQAGSPGPAGERGQDGHDGTPGARGQTGLRGARGPAGPPTDPRVVTKMVLVELEKTQRGETPAEWAKPYLDALKAEKLVVGYTKDGKNIRPHEKAEFERVVTVIGRVQQQLRAEIAAAEGRAKSYTDSQVGNEREQRISADAKKRKGVQSMLEGILGAIIGAAVVLAAAYFIWGRRPSQAAGPNEDYVGQLGAERDALGEPDPGGAVFGSLVRQRTSRYQRDECGRITAISRRVVEPAVGWVNAGTVPDTSAGGGNAALAISVGSVSVEGEEEAGKPLFPRGEKKVELPPVEKKASDVKPGPESESESELTDSERRAVEIAAKERLAEQVSRDDAAKAAIEKKTRESLKAVVDEAAANTDTAEKKGSPLAAAAKMLKKRVVRKKTPADAATIADATKSAEDKSAEAETEEV